ncbi:HNH endonuclease signature motif containing protein [Pannus brasiliensis CCIBt3594]|uniref:HNH endonuclease signature motif containing protein n=1 Tax=Pannus brasiliensis CCIBt3594 TaxID=1427578 RepID=A0AAW9QL74_9CHRO
MSRYISEEIKARVRREARERCGYCLSQQKYVLGQLEIDHIIPKALGGTDDEENLWLACRLCNGYKGIQVRGKDPLTGEIAPLYNPRERNWNEHFTWKENGVYIEGLTRVSASYLVTKYTKKYLEI